MHPHSFFSSQIKREEQRRKQERKSGLEKKDGLSKAMVGIIKDGEISQEKLLHQLKPSSINKDFKKLRSNSLREREDDEGLTPAKDDGL